MVAMTEVQWAMIAVPILIMVGIMVAGMLIYCLIELIYYLLDP